MTCEPIRWSGGPNIFSSRGPSRPHPPEQNGEERRACGLPVRNSPPSAAPAPVHLERPPADIVAYGLRPCAVRRGGRRGGDGPRQQPEEAKHPHVEYCKSDGKQVVEEATSAERCVLYLTNRLLNFLWICVFYQIIPSSCKLTPNTRLFTL
jgi:hypothetical protein